MQVDFCQGLQLLARKLTRKGESQASPVTVCNTDNPNEVHGNTHVGTVARGAIET